LFFLAVEKAVFFLDKDELPPHWDRDLLFGVNRICIAPDSEVFDGNVSLFYVKNNWWDYYFNVFPASFEIL